ncbi:piggyBac transposable element-derived protein 4-like [Rhagoletis pomonella]|uniref:piggyBac transposable element-derived protein 4-like n=1 Tax=Rhagoletis pomonella TaxID=28610 RepID=UPI001781C18A|nr:piggyBac transposable element-derived protein 4-like [Rhagoletis pomonella]
MNGSNIKLFQELDSDDESEVDPFSDDGEYGNDPYYVPDKDRDAGQSSDEESEKNDGPHCSTGTEHCENEIVQEDIDSYIFASSNESSDDTSEVEPNTCETESEGEWFENAKEIPQFNFDARNCGVKISLEENCTPRDIFDKIFTSDVMQKLDDSTNTYESNLCADNPHTRNARFTDFKPTNNEEMYKFLGICLLQGQVKAPKIRDLFSRDPFYYHPVFRHSMTGCRFEQLIRCLSCSAESGDETKLRKIQPLLNLFLQSFQSALYSGDYLSLDESLLLFRGRLQFRQYIKGKKAQYGIKLYGLTTSDGYVLNIEIYQGAEDNKQKSKVGNIVHRLMAPYLNKGHHLIMDNFYNSVELSKNLLSYKTHVTGTLRVNRKGNPKAITGTKLSKGEYIWRRQGRVYVSKWRDKREVLCITTGNHPQHVQTTRKWGRTIDKPNCRL